MRTGLQILLASALWFTAAPMSSALPRATGVPAEAQGAEQATNSPCGYGDGSEKPVRIEQSLIQGLLIHKVTPSYPKAARKAHIEGTVLLCASISKRGEIMNLKAVSGPEELIPPSLKAVKKWRYRPYLVDGVPVQVETEIRVNFTLGK